MIPSLPGLAAMALHACLAATAIGGTQEPAVPPAKPAAATQTRIDLRTSPLLDLHFLLRAAAAGNASPVPDGFGQAVEKVRDIDRALGSPLMWGLLEGTIAESPDIATIRAAFERLPEERPVPGGASVALRARALELADALAAAEPRFLAEAWPARRTAIEAARGRLVQGLIPRQAECFAFLTATLGMQDPGLEVPTYLVTSVPPFGGVTHRRPGGKPGGVCIVGIADNEGTLLDEAVLHESIHALDVATGGQRTVLNRLRTDMEAAGVSARSRAARDVPHTLMFVEAGEAVRRCIDPAHVPYGEAKGYYAKVPAARDAVVPAWQERLAGRIGEDDALARIVASAARAEAGAPAGAAPAKPKEPAAAAPR